MAEYIEREALIKQFCERCNEEMSESPCEPSECFAREVIIGVPAVDVAPVRHAKVIDKIYDDHETIKPWDYRYYCSACKIAIRDSWIKYCPNCGAKMDLVEDEDHG